MFCVLKFYMYFSLKILKRLLFSRVFNTFHNNSLYYDCFYMFLYKLRKRSVVTIICTALKTNSDHFFTMVLTFSICNKNRAQCIYDIVPTIIVVSLTRKRRDSVWSGPNRGLSFSATIGSHVPPHHGRIENSHK